MISSHNNVIIPDSFLDSDSAISLVNPPDDVDAPELSATPVTTGDTVATLVALLVELLFP